MNDFEIDKLWKEKIAFEEQVRKLTYELTLKNNQIRCQNDLITLRESTLREIQILIEKSFWAATEPFPEERYRKLYNLDEVSNAGI